jgi:NAD(P)-dependent dehydrogenase (short-subunit alcohol dehydrogenase family)
MGELDGVVAVVTGAGAGIGRAIARRMARTGARVAVTDQDEARAREVCQEITGAGGEAVAFRLGVTRKVEAEAVAHRILTAWGALDVWVNNAGVSTMRAFLEVTEEEWRFNMDVNALGTFLCSQVAASCMLRQSAAAETGLRGRIINVASMAGKRGNAPFLAPYVASKFAVVGLTQALAGELAPLGITVNAVCPGYVRTSMQEREILWEAGLRKITPREVQELYVRDTPLGRMETPEDVAGVVCFLAGAAASFITGEAIQVNGGAWMD